MRWMAAVLLIAALLLGCAQSGQPEKIRVGILPIEDSLPVVIAEESGLFKKMGLMLS